MCLYENKYYLSSPFYRRGECILFQTYIINLSNL
nr:MAG TPA: hypothetical protein [Caudoviricetes sp.]